MFSLQELSPAGAHFCLDVENFIQRELEIEIKGKKLLIAFSGGVDSSALALFCRVMQDRWQSLTVAAHLNHNLRTDSGLQAEAARELCSSLGIPCTLGSSKVRTYADRLGLGIEEAGRQLRYRFLQGVRKKAGADLILTGHHLNDLAEDSLLRQLRGTGWPALAGMPAWIPGSSVLRPFLLTPKDRLVRFVQEFNLSWLEDSSNLDLSYTRNRIRHTVLPRLLEGNPGYLACVAQLWRQAGRDEQFWAEELRRLGRLEQTGPGWIFLFEQGLVQSPPALRLRWYKDVLNRLGPGQARADSLFNLDRAWRRKSVGKAVEFPGRKRAEVSREGIRFELKRDEPPYPSMIDNGSSAC